MRIWAGMGGIGKGFGEVVEVHSKVGKGRVLESQHNRAGRDLRKSHGQSRNMPV